MQLPLFVLRVYTILQSYAVHGNQTGILHQSVLAYLERLVLLQQYIITFDFKSVYSFNALL